MKTIKKRIIDKLKAQAGESIAEVLIALLIAALALTMLASVISTSARIINQSKSKMAAYYDANDGLAKQQVTSDTFDILILIKKTTGTAEPYTSPETAPTIPLTPEGNTAEIHCVVNNEAGIPVISYWK